MHNAFPDFHLGIEDVISEKDKVVVRWESTSTHKGVFMGIPATNKVIVRNGVTIYRLVDGRIVDWWNKSDNLSLMQQLGVIPSPGQQQ